MGTPPVRLGTTEKAKLPHGAARGARPAIRMGRTARPVPLLSAPVGPEKLRARYPRINAPADLVLVDGCFDHLARLRNADAARQAGDDTTRKLLAVAEAVRNYKADRNGAITAFQRVEDTRNDAERADGVILPDGLTWETLFTYGELARELEDARDSKVGPVNYIHTGGFREQDFLVEATRRFGADHAVGPMFNARSVPGMMDLLRRIGSDPRVMDVRWAAYMLATAMWETNHTVRVPARPPAHGTRKVSQWGSPIEEGGKGKLNAHNIKNYYLPVKVEQLPDGRAKVLEQDGDTYTVGTDGKVASQSPHAIVGSNPHKPAVPDYVKASGVEQAYYGRGYCQLTWWNNYALTGAEIGLGLDLLFHPEKALEPAIAYEIMVHSMVYGSGFANRKRLQFYFCGSYTDYVGARAMVNGTDHAAQIAQIARIFEQCLMDNKA